MGLFRALVLLLLLGLLGAVVLYRDPFSASNFEVIPDSTEYALAAHRLVTAGEYKILVEGKWLPPRYPAGFSVLALAPTYLLFGLEPGNAIFAVTIFGVGGILLAFWIGKTIAGAAGGVGAALAVLALPSYRFWSQHVMSDVPATTLILGASLLHLKYRLQPNRKLGFFLFSGWVATMAVLFRPLSAGALLPFLRNLLFDRNQTSKMPKTALFLSSFAIAAAASLAYNGIQHGSCFRNGYQFWTAVPYDYPQLLFSRSYVSENLRILWESKTVLLVLLAIGAWWLHRRSDAAKEPDRIEKNGLQSLAEFVLWGTGPLILFHLVYFYSQDRFFLPTATLLATIVGTMVGSWLQKLPTLTLEGLVVLVLLWTVVQRQAVEYLPPYRRLAAEEILRLTPEGSWIVSGIEPAYLEYWVARKGERRVIPISREVEYASKLLVRQRIAQPDPPPQHWSDHRSEGLIRGGATDAVQFVAAEQMATIDEELRRGRKIYISTVFIDRKDERLIDELSERYLWIRHSRYLFELQARDDEKNTNTNRVRS